MGTRPAATAEDISSNVRAIVDRVLEADVTDAIAQRGRELAAAVGEATEAAVDRAGATWRDTAPVRSEAVKAARRAGRDAGTWGGRTWRKELRPLVRDLWTRRTVALGAAGAAIPAGRGLAETAAERLGIKQREARHWGTFFVGLLLGIAGGIVAALLTAPKRGAELREELAERAQTAVEVVGDKAQAVADDWMPLFQRETSVVDDAFETDVAIDPTDTVVEMAGDGGSAVDEMTDAVAAEVDAPFDEIAQEPTETETETKPT
jgi:gas vesicle protein